MLPSGRSIHQLFPSWKNIQVNSVQSYLSQVQNVSSGESQNSLLSSLVSVLMSTWFCSVQPVLPRLLHQHWLTRHAEIHVDSALHAICESTPSTILTTSNPQQLIKIQIKQAPWFKPKLVLTIHLTQTSSRLVKQLLDKLSICLLVITVANHDANPHAASVQATD